MKIAVLLKNICLSVAGSSIRKVLLFEVEDEVITAVDEDIISMADINYLYLWLLGKRVVRLYCDGLGAVEKVFIEKMEITVYPLDTIRDHPILQALLLKEKENDQGES